MSGKETTSRLPDVRLQYRAPISSTSNRTVAARRATQTWL
jgi:hypothetical protein